MNKKHGLWLVCLVLSIVLIVGMMPTTALATEPAGKFILVVEAGGKLVVAPEYVTYTEGQTIGEALVNSGHIFTGIEQGQVTAVDDVTGNFTRSDQNGGYDLTTSASEVTHYSFSERSSSESKPNDGVLLLMTAMAEYLECDIDVRNAAKAEYNAAKMYFVGCSSDDARTLAYDLNTAVSSYKETVNGTKYTVSFTDGSKIYSASNYPGVAINIENAYGKAWTDDGDGKIDLPIGNYSFCIEQNGMRVEGSIAVSEAMTIAVKLPADTWLKLDKFRLSGSYGADTNEENKFTDDEFVINAWTDRKTAVSVSDMFNGAVYVYAEYDKTLLSEIPTLTAIYKMANSGETMEKKLAFESLTSGAFEVLAKGAADNVVIYRVTSKSGGYTYSQDYTVVFGRVPTLTSVTVEDQNGTDQAPTYKFTGDVNEYTYKVLDTATEIAISAKPLEEHYSITVNGTKLEDEVTVPVNGQTTVSIVVSAGEYSNTYTLNIQPGEGKTLSFISDKAVSVEVVNSNGVVMPYTTHRETDTTNRYRYTLVPGESYHYVATKDTYYHIADDFKLEEVANSTITIDFEDMDDWLKGLSLGTGKSSKLKNTIALDSEFSPDDHSYEAVYQDTEHNVFIWATGSEKKLKIEAIYNQVFPNSLYHGKETKVELVSNSSTGEKLNRILMDENPVENVLTVRVTKEENGVTYYQDYEIALTRSLTLKDLSAKCDGVTTVLVQEDGDTGFEPSVKQYDVTVSLAAQYLELTFAQYEDNLCYGEENVGYRILIDGKKFTGSGKAVIELDGSFETQIVTIIVENDKSPTGTSNYIINVLKSPPVAATFDISPDDAQLSMYETMSGERLWPDENGDYMLCEGYSYRYTLTEHGYVGKTGILDVTRDEDNVLVVMDNSDVYVVEEHNDGGIVVIEWALKKAPTNSEINPNVTSSWPNFRGGDKNNAKTDYPVPNSAENGTLYWANKLGSGIDSDAVGSPILVGGDIITYASDNIFRIDTVTGEILAVGKMDHKSSFSITPPTYAEGMVFVALSDGCVQAFNAITLESLWLYKDPLGGQPNCPLNVKNGYLYTGFWNSETGDANFVCISVTDEDPTQQKESKCNSWYRTAKGGYYWAGVYISDSFVLVGTDDGTNKCNSKTSSLLLLDAKTGKELDRWDNLNGDIRSTVVYDESTDAYYFTSKGGTFYSVRISGGNKITNMWSVALQNNEGGIPMSTSSPVVYNGRAYIGVSGAGQFSAYSGHNITVIDINSKSIAYSVKTKGYPQTSGLLTTAYEEESGYVYVYFFDNYTPGKLRVLRDKPGMTGADYVITEGDYTVAYDIFTPTGEQAQYAICSPVVDDYGTIYFKNDSAHLMAYGSTIEKIEITAEPEKTSYLVGEKFDPTGMVVTATYANGKTRDITEYVSYNEETLTEQDAAFTISFEYVMYRNQENGTEMTSGVVTKTPYVVLELTVTEGILGDVNNDGTIDAKDVQMILDYEAKLISREPSLMVSDVSGDGVIDSNDAVLISQYIDGKITSFPAEDN